MFYAFKDHNVKNSNRDMFVKNQITSILTTHSLAGFKISSVS